TAASSPAWTPRAGARKAWPWCARSWRCRTAWAWRRWARALRPRPSAPPCWSWAAAPGRATCWAGPRPAGCAERGGSAADHQQPDLAHVLNGVLDALAAEAGILHPAVWHVVHAEAGHVAAHHAADLQPVPGAHGVVQAVGEHAGLQAEVRIVGRLQGRIEILEALQQRHRAERLLALQLAMRRHVLQQGRLEHVALAAATDDDLRPGLARRLDPAFQPARRVLVDHRADEGLLVLRVAGDESEI